MSVVHGVDFWLVLDQVVTGRAGRHIPSLRSGRDRTPYRARRSAASTSCESELPSARSMPSMCGFQPEARDRVEFAVVTEDVEGLSALENRVGVGAVAGMTERDGRSVFGIAEFRIIAAQDFDRALHLVDDAARGKRREMDAELAFDVAFAGGRSCFRDDPARHARSFRRFARRAARFSRRCVRARRIRPAGALDQNVQTGVADAVS